MMINMKLTVIPHFTILFLSSILANGFANEIQFLNSQLKGMKSMKKPRKLPLVLFCCFLFFLSCEKENRTQLPLAKVPGITDTRILIALHWLWVDTRVTWAHRHCTEQWLISSMSTKKVEFLVGK
jgi:hypothetical protein